MKIGVCCPTYCRPLLLGRLVHCFLQQTHDNFKLFVVDDAGQYESKDYGKWEMISLEKRFPNLGAKRQFCVDLLDSSYDGYQIADDDDAYWPHALSSVAKVLENAPWAQCRHVYETVRPGVLGITPAFGKRPLDWGYGGCWSYRLDAMRHLGGYLDAPGADDLRLARKFHARFGDSANSTEGTHPWYWYCREPGVQKVSDEGIEFWEKREAYACEAVEKINVGWNGPNLYDWEVIPDNPRPW